MVYRVIASILLLFVLAALAFMQEDSSTSPKPAAATSTQTNPLSSDEAAFKSLKIN